MSQFETVVRFIFFEGRVRGFQCLFNCGAAFLASHGLIVFADLITNEKEKKRLRGLDPVETVAVACDFQTVLPRVVIAGSGSPFTPLRLLHLCLTFSDNKSSSQSKGCNLSPHKYLLIRGILEAGLTVFEPSQPNGDFSFPE